MAFLLFYCFTVGNTSLFGYVKLDVKNWELICSFSGIFLWKYFILTFSDGWVSRGGGHWSRQEFIWSAGPPRGIGLRLWALTEPTVTQKTQPNYGQGHCCTMYTQLTNIPSSYYIIYKIWDNLSLIGKIPERGDDWGAVSFLSLLVTTGRDVEMGMTHCGGLSLTVKSVGQKIITNATTT